MKNYLLPLIIGIASGLLIGGIARFSVHHASTTERPSSANGTLPTAEQASPSSSESPELPRPTFEEVSEISGLKEAGLLARYLADATIEEVISLMELAIQDESPLKDLDWMIQLRGLELDSDQMIAWAKGQEGNGRVHNSLYRRWAVVDPHAALKSCLEAAPGIRDSVIRAMKGGNIDEALAAIEALDPDAPELTDFRELKWAALAETDIQGALAGALAIEDKESRTETLRAVVGRWAGKDALAAIQWIESQDDLQGRDRMLRSAIRKLADTQPSLAQSKVEAMPLSRERNDLEEDVIRTWASKDPDGALQWVKSLPESPRRDSVFAAVISKAEMDPESLFNLVREMDIDVLQNQSLSYVRERLGPNAMSFHVHSPLPDILQRAVIELATESPQEAMATVYELGLESASAQPVVEMWVQRDPEGAAKWATNLEDSDFSQQMQKSVLEVWATESPEASATFATAQGLADQPDLSQAIAKEWARHDAEAAIAWAGTLNDNIRGEVLSTTLTAVANTNPQQALQHVNQIADPEAQQQLLTTATNTWVQRDPVSTLDWLTSQPPEANINHVLKDTAKAWVLNQPQAASEWISTMTPSPRRDHAVAGIVHALISSENPQPDHAAADVWIHEIADPLLRQQWMDEINNRR